MTEPAQERENQAWLWGIVGLTALVTLGKLALAARWGLIADEAYYWVWAQQPALGYYDQPPLTAWLIAATTAVGDSEWLVRLGFVLCGLIGPLALWPHADQKDLHLLWWMALPPLCWLTFFATPDAPLLAAWAVALSAAIAGGPWWLLAGLAAGLGALAKYTGLLVLPLLILGAGPRDWRTPWPWAGLGVMALCVAPNLVWNAGHDWISFRFQLEEGLVNPHAPGLAGPLAQVRDQVLVITPIAWFAAVWWWGQTAARARDIWGEGDRVERLAWFASAPVAAFFFVAAWGGPPEAHWPVPAYIGAGLGLSHARGRLERVAHTGAWMGFLLCVALAWHGNRPLIRFPTDPGKRLTEGRVLASWVTGWAMPEGIPLDEPRPELARPVYTERYQEAALIHYNTGIPAKKLPGCGRADQYDLWFAEAPLPDAALFVRVGFQGRSECLEARFHDVEAPSRTRGIDPLDRTVAWWQIYEARR